MIRFATIDYILTVRKHIMKDVETINKLNTNYQDIRSYSARRK